MRNSLWYLIEHNHGSHKFVCSFTHLLIQQIFTKYLLCTMHHSESWYIMLVPTPQESICGGGIGTAQVKTRDWGKLPMPVWNESLDVVLDLSGRAGRRLFIKSFQAIYNGKLIPSPWGWGMGDGKTAPWHLKAGLELTPRLNYSPVKHKYFLRILTLSKIIQKPW